MSDWPVMKDQALVNLDGDSEPTSMVLELAREIEQARLEAGLSIEELLMNLRRQRDRYYREIYAADQPE